MWIVQCTVGNFRFYYTIEGHVSKKTLLVFNLGECTEEEKVSRSK